MGLVTLTIVVFHGHLTCKNLKLDSQSRLTIPEFSGYHCTR